MTVQERLNMGQSNSESSRNYQREIDALRKRITELEAAQAEWQEDRRARQEIEERYQMLFETMLNGFALHEIICDVDGNPVDYRFLTVNPAFERLTGLRACDIVGRTVREVLPNTEPVWIETYGRVALTGEPIAFENYSQELDRYYEVNAYRTAPGQFAVIFADVTDRQRAQQEVLRRHQQLLSIFDGIDQVIHVCDPQSYQVLYANEAARTQWGDIVGQPCYLAIHGRTTPCPFCTNDRIFGENVGKTYIWEYFDERCRRWYRCIDKAIEWPDGRLVRYEMAIDITALRKAEEERRRMELQVQQAQKLESLGVLAGGIAHDFNNLLMAILGNADLALQDLSEVSPARPMLEEIEIAARRAADLCRQMLAYSGKGRFVLMPINLSEVVSEMVHMLQVSVSKKAVLRFHCAETLPSIEADPTQIRQVIMNLIINASEAIGNRSGVISISTGAMECDRQYLTSTHLDESLPEGCYVYLEVTDTGSGMDAETQARIFDPFFTTKFTGRGLGLAAVLGIVRGHRGAIKVYSEPGRGTTFKILFPAIDLPPETIHPERFPGEHWCGTGTVLLVDDEETVRTLGKRMLERLGFDVLVACDGREALNLFAAHGEEIVCVILDLTMPHMDGEETFRELRRIRPNVRVVMSSGYNEQEIVQRFAGKSLAGFIQKPYQLARLAATLRNILE